jgi:long-chain acyl-CoA synthetase
MNNVQARINAPTPRWGRHIADSTVNGHPCRVYTERPRSLGALLLDAQRWQGREFVVQGSRRLTVEQHARAVARVALFLRERGVNQGDAVMLLAYNQIEWLLAFWALQSLGACVVLGNAWWSDTETAAAVTLARPVLLLTDRSVTRALPPDVPSLALNSLRKAAESDTFPMLPECSVDEDAPALVIFSSGTTGQAKGVVMSHRCVIANIHNLLVLTGRLPEELPPDHEGTVSLISMPLFHLAGIQTSFMTMLSGGRLVLLQGRFDPLEVLELMERERIRAWGTVPTMVSRVLQHPQFSQFDTTSVASIQMGGAAVPEELRTQVRHAFPQTHKRVGTMYGLTEAGGVIAAGGGNDGPQRPGCVGNPLPTVEVRIRKPDADGVGEIVVRTPTATSGYLADRTPIVDADGWLWTGDLGHVAADGRLYVTGRSKDTIIRGGENIACAHVEQVLLGHPEVLEAAAVPLAHPDLGEEVGAAVVLRTGSMVDAQELIAHASAQLARFEVPTRWWLSQRPLPVNASGKVLKRELIAHWPGGGK